MIKKCYYYNREGVIRTRVRYVSPVEKEGQALYARNDAEQRIMHEDVFPLPDVGVNLVLCGGEGACVAPHWHDELELLYVLESGSSVEVVVDGQRRVKEQGDLILFNPRAIHEIASGFERGIMLQIPVKFWKQFLPEYEQLTFSLEQGAALLSDMKRLMLELYDVYNEKRMGYKLRFTSLLCRLMDDLVSGCATEAKKTTGFMMTRKIVGIAEVIEYIEQHHAEKLSVAGVASRFGYHPNYLSRLFQQSMGHTVLEYIYMVRIHQVYCDLLYTDKAVRRIFEDHGCTNSKVAMRMFKETYHMTPKEVRRRKLNETDKS